MKIRFKPEYRNLLRPLNDKEFADLVASIKANGQLVPIIINKGNNCLLDGHHRLRACRELNIKPNIEYVDLGEKSEIDIVYDSNQKRRQMNTIDAVTALGKVREILQKKARKSQTAGLKQSTHKSENMGRVNEKLADKLGISRSTYEHALKVVESKDTNLIKKIQAGNMTINKAYSKIKTQAAIKEKVKVNRKLAKEYKAAGNAWHVIDGDIRFDKINIKADLIFTDPPYDKEHMPLYKNLGKFAEKTLADKAGASLVTYTPSYDIESALKLINEGIDETSLELEGKDNRLYKLKLNWILAVEQDQAKRIYDNNVMLNCKLLLWFVKGKHDYTPVQALYRTKNKNEKIHHKWQQALDVADYYIKTLVRPNSTVCDPFVGSGTTGIAALKHNCKFWGMDVETADIARGRIIQWEKDQKKDKKKPVTPVTVKPLSILPTAGS